jgi:hypothetical protein
MVERDALLTSPVIRGAGCWADVSSPNNRRRSTQPAGTADPTSEPTERMFRLRAKARPTIMPAIFREVPSCVNSVSMPVAGAPSYRAALGDSSYLAVPLTAVSPPYEARTSILSGYGVHSPSRCLRRELQTEVALHDISRQTHYAT